MTFSIGYVLCLTLAALAVLVSERVQNERVGLGVLVALLAAGLLTPVQALSTFGNGALLTVGASFVLAAGLTGTGAVEGLGRRLLALGGGSEARLLAAMMLVAAAFSVFVNNTPLAVVLLPIVIGLADRTGVAPSKLLIPMSYATIVGGMCTVIGTSTSVLVSGALPAYGVPAMPMFEPLPLAAAGVAMTVLYMVVLGRRLLPSRSTVASSVRTGNLRSYVTEVLVPEGSALVGTGIADGLRARAPSVRVLQWIRDEAILPPGAHAGERLRAGDALILRGDVKAVLALEAAQGVEVAPALRAAGATVSSSEASLVELVVKPGSPQIGRAVRDLGLHARHGALVLAVQRHDQHVREKVADLRLRFGDVLLVQVDDAGLEGLRHERGFVVAEGVLERAGGAGRAPLALGTVGAVLGLAALKHPALGMPVLAVGGALAMVATRCVSARDALRAVDFRLLVLMAGMIGLGRALSTTGAADVLAKGLVSAASGLGPVGVLSAIYLATNLLTALASNAAAALVMLPVALATARSAGLADRPFVMAVVFAASIDFSTPIGYQTNTLVYGPGGYRFSDYVRVGVPLNLLWWALATVLIPLLWPLARG